MDHRRRVADRSRVSACRFVVTMGEMGKNDHIATPTCLSTSTLYKELSAAAPCTPSESDTPSLARCRRLRCGRPRPLAAATAADSARAPMPHPCRRPSRHKGRGRRPRPHPLSCSSLACLSLSRPYPLSRVLSHPPREHLSLSLSLSLCLEATRRRRRWQRGDAHDSGRH